MSVIRSRDLSWGAALFRLLLVVSLWEGPVVWGHAHNVSVQGSAEGGLAAKDLWSHVSQFHACHGDCEHLGWHWHISFPQEDGNNPTQSSRTSTPAVVGVSSAVIAGCWTIDLTDSAALALGGIRSTDQARREYLTSHSIFDRSETCSPQQLLCRLSC